MRSVVASILLGALFFSSFPGMARADDAATLLAKHKAYVGWQFGESHGWSLHRGLVGFDFLKHFDYVFDYPHGIMYMIPHKD